MAMPVAAPYTATPLRWRETRSATVYAEALLPAIHEAIAVSPDRADLQLEYARALFRTKKMSALVNLAGSTINDDSVAPNILYLLGHAACETKKYEMALEAFRRAGAKGFAPAYGFVAETLYRLDRSDEALAEAVRVLDVSTSDAAAIKTAAAVHLKRNRPELLWKLCTELKARGGSGPWLLSAMASAAAALGNRDDFDAIIDRDRWMSVTQLPVSDEFNGRLAAELLTLRASGTGMRIDDLESIGGSMAQALIDRIRNAVDLYAAERQVFADDPVNLQRPPVVTIRNWAIITHGIKHNGWHVHQVGWISGVYYVKIPAIQSNADRRAGAIEFGPYPFGNDDSMFKSYRWHIAPKPGQLVIFPSYYPHRSIPTQVEDIRISAPFDVMPFVAPTEAGK
jgi:tetratricopeptide (TPR) repeat protein